MNLPPEVRQCPGCARTCGQDVMPSSLRTVITDDGIKIVCALKPGDVLLSVICLDCSFDEAATAAIWQYVQNLNGQVREIEGVMPGEGR